MIAIKKPRKSSPEVLHKIWDSIEAIGRNGGRVPCPTEVLTELEKVHGVERGVAEAELFFAVADGLVDVERSRNGDMLHLLLPGTDGWSEQPSHDWYCFYCHLGGGPINGCGSCRKVYHTSCARVAGSSTSWTQSQCPACISVFESKKPEWCNIKRLNHLLTMLVEKVRDKNFSVLNSSKKEIWTIASGRKVKSSWRYDVFVYEPIDLELIRRKALKLRYGTLEEFKVDCDTLLHNLKVYFSSKNRNSSVSVFPEAFDYFRNSILEALEDINSCPDCFERVTLRQPNFTLPCAKPHPIVWIETSGLYWPAKMMRQEGNRFQVMLFGGDHSRFWVDGANMATHDLNAPSTRSGNNSLRLALEELEEFLENSQAPTLSISDDGNRECGESSTRKNGKIKSLKNANKSKKVASVLSCTDADTGVIENEWEVERIVDTNLVDGIRYYLVSWKGYTEDQNTWEPVEHLHCPDLISVFHEEFKRPSTSCIGDDRPPGELWEVEEILDSNVHEETGDRLYLIAWKGFPPEANSWEIESNLNCDKLIEEFKLRQKSKNLGKVSSNGMDLQKKSKGRRTAKKSKQPRRKCQRAGAAGRVLEIHNVKENIGAANLTTRKREFSKKNREMGLTNNECKRRCLRSASKIALPVLSDFTFPPSVCHDIPAEIPQEETPGDSDGDFLKKLERCYGGPWYEDGNTASFLCLICNEFFPGELVIQNHISGAHPSFLR